MRPYTWSCLACGSSNGALISSCDTCGCPSHCTVREVERYREIYLSTGGVVGPAAGLLREENDITGVQVLHCVASLLLGFLPFGHSIIKALAERLNANE